MWIEFNPPENGDRWNMFEDKSQIIRRQWLCIPSGLSADRISRAYSWGKISHCYAVGNLSEQTQKHRSSSFRQHCCSYLLSDKPLHHSGSREGPAVFVGDGSIDIAFKEREHGKPDAGSATLLVGPCVS